GSLSRWYAVSGSGSSGAEPERRSRSTAASRTPRGSNRDERGELTLRAGVVVLARACCVHRAGAMIAIKWCWSKGSGAPTRTASQNLGANQQGWIRGSSEEERRVGEQSRY